MIEEPATDGGLPAMLPKLDASPAAVDPAEIFDEGNLEGMDGSKLHADGAQLQVLARLQTLEAGRVASDMLVHNLYRILPQLDEAQQELNRDVTEWANRATPAARSSLAKAARARVLTMIEDLREDRRTLRNLP